MRIFNINKTSNKNNYNPSFKGFYNNKILIKGVEFAADNAPFFAATTTVMLSSFVRPLAILATPKAEVENKQYACAKSISSSIINLGVVALITAPIVSGINNVENNPEKFLNKNTIKNLQGKSKNLKNAKPFRFASQFFKLGSSLLTAVPKTILTVMLISPIMAHFFNKQKAGRLPALFFHTLMLHFAWS